MAEKETDVLELETQADETATFTNKLFRRWMKGCRKQHRAFEDADKFVVGNQWDPEDVAKLNAENRPVAVFNYCKRHIDVVSGVQILNNLSPIFLPRVVDSEQAQIFAEMATGAHDFVMQSCDGYYEIAGAFRDLVVRGMGFVKERLDLIAEPGGRIVWEKVDGRHIVWDTDSRKQNLEDSRGFIFFSKVPKQECANEWPEHKAYIMSSDATDHDDVFGTSAQVEQVVPPPYDPLNRYDTDAIDSSDKHSVILKECYWYEDEEYFEYVDPFNAQGGLQEMKASEFRKFKREYAEMYPEAPEVEGARRLKRIYKRAFVIGRKTMEETDAPCQTHFPILAMTADWDDKEKVFTGLPLGVLKDPQRFVNKYLSQTMHSIATAPKGSLLFEDGAFDNIVMAEEQWASWAPFIPMSPGAMGGINGQGKRYDYIPPANPPQIMMEMFKACIDVISQISGISQEMLTGGEGEVPGITMRQRQQVAMIAMASYFNAYRRMLKAEAEITFDQVRRFYSDDRVILIGGDYNSQAVKLSQWRAELDCQYVVSIDDHPYSANSQMAYWEALVQSGILPGLFKTGAILQMPSLVDAFPLWSKPKAEMKKWMMGMASQMQPGQIPGQKPQKQQGQGGKPDLARNAPEVVAATVEHKKAQSALTNAKVVETLMKARHLDAQSKHAQVQQVLDQMALSFEQQAKHREHSLKERQLQHDMNMGQMDSMQNMYSALASGGQGGGQQ